MQNSTDMTSRIDRLEKKVDKRFDAVHEDIKDMNKTITTMLLQRPRQTESSVPYSLPKDVSKIILALIALAASLVGVGRLS